MQIDLRGHKILVADADRTVLEMLQIRLDLAGFHTCIARSGPAALEVYKNVRPVCVLIDQGLPEMDGFSVLQALAKHRETAPPPSLFMARRFLPEDVKRASSLGARDFLLKPFSGAQVLERVARLLKNAKDPSKLIQYV